MTNMGRGRPQKVTDRELIEAGKQVEGPAWTVSEITDALNVSGQLGRERMKKLAAQGVIKRKRVAGVTVCWLPVPEEG
jgi:Mn-dependent DtxR family transcriptional regulator